jgi:hypothetical protein
VLAVCKYNGNYLTFGTAKAASIWKSTDGITWTKLSGISGNVFGCSMCDGYIWTAGSGGMAGMWRSENGTSWTKIIDTPMSSRYLHTCAMIKGVFIISIYTSNNSVENDAGLWYCDVPETMDYQNDIVTKMKLRSVINDLRGKPEFSTDEIDLSDQDAQKAALGALLKALGFTVRE